jgi:murein DD-endopeptidase MepM/ murein hydrolase activator NlpD
MLLGLAVLGLALVPLPTHGSPDVAPPTIEALSDEELGQSQASKPLQLHIAGSPASTPVSGSASAPSDKTPTSQSRPPSSKEAPPEDAMPVTRLQPVTGSRKTSSSQGSSTPQRLEVALVAASPDLSELAQQVASMLSTDRVTASATGLEALKRPDVLLLLGDASEGASVWFCSPSSNASEKLATSLLQTLAPLPSEPEGANVADALPCDTLYTGRAKMAAALVRLPEDAGPDFDAPQALARALSSYLTNNAGFIQSSRSATRIVWPAYGPITSHYGPDHPLGIDIGQSTGDIVAATDGVVTFAGGDPCCSYGNYVTIDSRSGITTLYAHFDSIYVKQGQQVKAGQALGKVGCTGHCTGNHLHFETLVNGVRVDPMTLLP